MGRWYEGDVTCKRFGGMGRGGDVIGPFGSLKDAFTWLQRQYPESANELRSSDLAAEWQPRVPRLLRCGYYATNARSSDE